MPLKHNLLSGKQTWIKLFIVYVGLFITWSLYRLIFHHSVWIEEIFIKGVVFSLPLFLLPLKEKSPMKALGITTTNFFQSVYLGITLGLILGLAGQVGNFIRNQTILFSDFNLTSANIGAFLVLSLITAFWEQLLFSGYYVKLFRSMGQNELNTVSIVGLLFSLIHLPNLIFVQHVNISQLILSFGLLFTLSVGCSILRLRQKNLIAPIMAHALWGVTIFLFR